MQSINHGSFSLHMNTKPTLFTKKATLSPLNGFCTSVNKPIVCICVSLFLNFLICSKDLLSIPLLVSHYLNCSTDSPLVP